jgi:uncharacterized membrane protein/mono/diheme cytochrome c family protein
MLWTFFGRLHPATVHFPIAMFSVAALVEFLQIVRRKPGLAPATFTLTVVGLVSAVVAALMGIANAGGKHHDDLIENHRWAGIATTVAAVAAMALVFKARAGQGRIVQVARGSLFLAMILVSLTGHWGGAITLPGYYDVWGRPEVRQKPSEGPVDFVQDIRPIIQTSCFSCHGGDKGGKNGKGGLKLTTRALAMKGGDGGPCIVPKKPEESSFFTLLLEKDPDKRMPDKAKPLPPEQIDKVRRWIEQGAVWPDGYEFKK